VAIWHNTNVLMMIKSADDDHKHQPLLGSSGQRE
jgi:hypothetical protein